jgi:hypothetical protein
MPMQMEWMFACIGVVKNNLDNVSFLENERIGVDTIRNWVGRVFAQSESSKQAWNLWWDEWVVVYKSTDLLAFLKV